ncbi:MAG: hypothetical protein FWD16_07825, partial [Clostridia bacterium]|nr:hypothetical protein [Clostridia bacterium]
MFKELLPEAIETVRFRWGLLAAVSAFGPVGRRRLAELLATGERTVRGECDHMTGIGLVYVGRRGIKLTPRGFEQLDSLDNKALLPPGRASPDVVVAPCGPWHDALKTALVGREAARALAPLLIGQ